jgi:MFS transporter, ACS family, solute carrier family 17 (sodium-dependent inorganic phosphate cotransporter), member 6/7/8
LTPAVYSTWNKWSSPEEKTSLLAISFAGSAVGMVINYPISALLCFTGLNNGWPMIFYVPGVGAGIWCILYFLLAYDDPEDHPRISVKENDYLEKHSCYNINTAKLTNIEKQVVPWKKIVLSIPVHALWIVAFSAKFILYSITVNIPLYINDVFDVGIIVVRKSHL